MNGFVLFLRHLLIVGDKELLQVTCQVGVSLTCIFSYGLLLSCFGVNRLVAPCTFFLTIATHVAVTCMKPVLEAVQVELLAGCQVYEYFLASFLSAFVGDTFTDAGISCVGGQFHAADPFSVHHIGVCPVPVALRVDFHVLFSLHANA